MKYKVYSIAMDRKTRKPIMTRYVSDSYKPLKNKKRIRLEIIDTKTNSLFKKCKTPQAIERIYESFWNKLNPNSKEIIKVTGVIKK